MAYGMDRFEIKSKETHVQELATPRGAGRLYLAQLRRLVAAAQGWPDDTVLEIEADEAFHGAAPTLILRRDLLAADQATKEN